MLNAGTPFARNAWSAARDGRWMGGSSWPVTSWMTPVQKPSTSAVVWRATYWVAPLTPGLSMLW